MARSAQGYIGEDVALYGAALTIITRRVFVSGMARQPRLGGDFGVWQSEPVMPAEIPSSHEHSAREAAFSSLAAAAAESIPGVDFASITVREDDHTLYTAAATDPLAVRADDLQYELREGPCYAAVTDERFVLVSDLATAAVFPGYAPKAVDLGVGAQAAIEVVAGRQRVGLNLYARTAGALDSSTVQVVDFAKRAGVVLHFAEQAAQLGETRYARTEESESAEGPKPHLLGDP